MQNTQLHLPDFKNYHSFFVWDVPADSWEKELTSLDKKKTLLLPIEWARFSCSAFNGDYDFSGWQNSESDLLHLSKLLQKNEITFALILDPLPPAWVLEKHPYLRFFPEATKIQNKDRHTDLYSCSFYIPNHEKIFYYWNHFTEKLVKFLFYHFPEDKEVDIHIVNPWQALLENPIFLEESGAAINPSFVNKFFDYFRNMKIESEQQAKLLLLDGFINPNSPNNLKKIFFQNREIIHYFRKYALQETSLHLTKMLEAKPLKKIRNNYYILNIYAGYNKVTSHHNLKDREVYLTGTKKIFHLSVNHSIKTQQLLNDLLYEVSFPRLKILLILKSIFLYHIYLSHSEFTGSSFLRDKIYFRNKRQQEVPYLDMEILAITVSLKKNINKSLTHNKDIDLKEILSFLNSIERNKDNAKPIASILFVDKSMLALHQIDNQNETISKDKSKNYSATKKRFSRGKSLNPTNILDIPTNYALLLFYQRLLFWQNNIKLLKESISSSPLCFLDTKGFFACQHSLDVKKLFAESENLLPIAFPSAQEITASAKESGIETNQFIMEMDTPPDQYHKQQTILEKKLLEFFTEKELNGMKNALFHQKDEKKINKFLIFGLPYKSRKTFHTFQKDIL